MAAADEVDDVIEQYQLALSEFVKGDPEPAKKVWSHRDDVSLANPLGPPARGWDEVAQTMERAASIFTDGEMVGFENVAKYVTSELAYAVWLERAKVKLGGMEDFAPSTLRVTMIFLLESVEADLARKHEEAEIAASTEAWLMTLRERVHEVEGNSEEAFRARRQLVRLLVEGIVIEDRRKGDEPRVRVTYRFDPPEAMAGEQDGGELWEVSRNTNEFLKAKAEDGR